MRRPSLLKRCTTRHGVPTAIGKRLGVTRKTLSELVNGQSGVSPEMAIRISVATTSTAELVEYADVLRNGRPRKKPETIRAANWPREVFVTDQKPLASFRMACFVREY